MPQNDPFRNHQRGASAPATDAFAVTPDDAADLATVARAVYVGGGGDVSLMTLAGSTVTFRAVPAGALLPCSARRIMATGTTATHLVGLV